MCFNSQFKSRKRKLQLDNVVGGGRSGTLGVCFPTKGGGVYIMCLVLIYNELLAKHLKTHFLKIEWSNIIDFIQTYKNSMNKF